MILSKKTKKVTRRVVVKPAQVKEEPTGELREVIIIGEDGKRRKEERPITKQVYYEPVVKEATEKVEYWNVEHEGEHHEFASKEDAERFLKG